jgi:hypothetical protein
VKKIKTLPWFDIHRQPSVQRYIFVPECGTDVLFWGNDKTPYMAARMAAFLAGGPKDYELLLKARDGEVFEFSLRSRAFTNVYLSGGMSLLSRAYELVLILDSIEKSAFYLVTSNGRVRKWASSVVDGNLGLYDREGNYFKIRKLLMDVVKKMAESSGLAMLRAKPQARENEPMAFRL